MFLSNNYVISLSPHPIRKSRVSLLVAWFKRFYLVKMPSRPPLYQLPLAWGHPQSPDMLSTQTWSGFSTFLSHSSDACPLGKVNLSGSQNGQRHLPTSVAQSKREERENHFGSEKAQALKCEKVPAIANHTQWCFPIDKVVHVMIHARQAHREVTCYADKEVEFWRSEVFHLSLASTSFRSRFLIQV